MSMTMTAAHLPLVPARFHRFARRPRLAFASTIALPDRLDGHSAGCRRIVAAAYGFALDVPVEAVRGWTGKPPRLTLADLFLGAVDLADARPGVGWVPVIVGLSEAVAFLGLLHDPGDDNLIEDAPVNVERGLSSDGHELIAAAHDWAEEGSDLQFTHLLWGAQDLASQRPERSLREWVAAIREALAFLGLMV